MKEILFYGVIAIALLLLSFIHAKMRKKFLTKLSYLLYRDLDGDKYLHELDSFSSKLYIRKKTRSFMKVDGYLLKGDISSAIEVLRSIEKMSLSYAKKIGLYKKQVQVYIDAKMYDEAIIANDNLQAMIVGKVTDNNMLSMAEDLNDLVEINAKQNGELADKMVDKAKESVNKLAQSMYYYRAAKCYYFKGNKAKVVKYLEEAKRKSDRGSWQDHIEVCLKDNTILLDK